MKRLLFALPIVIFAGLAVLFWIQLGAGPPTYIPSGMIGKTAPEVALPPMDEMAQGFTRADLGAGKPVIVNFWASWCVPCRLEHATLMELAKRQGVTLYGIDYKEAQYGKTEMDARGFLEELGNPFSKIDRDEQGRVSIDWGVTGVPETFVIDGKGVIRDHYAGPLTEETIRQRILPALKP